MNSSEVGSGIQIEPQAYHLPPRFLPLFGTALWEQMDEAARREYSKHEASAQFSYGMWFENILINALMRHLYDTPATELIHRTLCREVAEEAEHSTFFGDFIRSAKTPAYLPSRWLRLQGKFFKLTGTRPVFYLSILAAESLLEFVNQETIKDRSLHPVYREIIERHSNDERGHVSFAKNYLRTEWADLGKVAKLYALLYTPIVVYTIVQATVCEEVYLQLGMVNGHAQAWKNPRRRRWVTEALSPYLSFLEELGPVNDGTRWLWRRLGLTL